jgi:hypothetical protein
MLKHEEGQWQISKGLPNALRDEKHTTWMWFSSPLS